MDIFDLFATISLDTGEYERALDGAQERTQALAGQLAACFTEIAAVGKERLSETTAATAVLAAETAALGETVEREGKELALQMTDVGRGMVRGLWAGMQSMDSWLQGQVNGMLSEVVAGARRTLEIRSPSRVFARIGAEMAAGLGEGWNGGMGLVKENVTRTLDFHTAEVEHTGAGALRIQRETARERPDGGEATIIVQSVLDGKVIGETAYRYGREKERAYGV